MLSEKEMACFQRVLASRRQAIQVDIADLDEGRARHFEYPLAGMSLKGFKWQDTTMGRLRQIVLLPIALIVFVFMLMLTPLAYLGYCWSKRKRRNSLERELERVDAMSPPIVAGRPKTLESLYRLFEIDSSWLSDNDAVTLLGDWIETLYGPDVRNEVDVATRAEQLGHRRSSAYKHLSRQGTLISFSPLGWELAKEIDDVLPPYE